MADPQIRHSTSVHINKEIVNRVASSSSPGKLARDDHFVRVSLLLFQGDCFRVVI